MAIIRTQLVGSERRIITKVVNGVRRVSCSCCEEPECCMYPADRLGVGYAVEDLPDKIKFVGGEFTKNNPPLVFTNDPNVLIYYGFASEGVGIAGGEGLWRQFVDFGGTEGAGCLIGDIGGSLFTDDFADTYMVTHNTGSGTVSRTSLCVWEGEDNNGCPLYLEYRDEGPSALKWVLNWTVFIDGIGCESGEAGPKESPQNSPVGTYTDPSASSTATVSE
jgi:hypothetical protein